MIPARSAIQAKQLHERGWSTTAIARHLGHTPTTIRTYLRGQRSPGRPHATTDAFAPLAAYTARRLRQDPHLPATSLHRELATLGYAGSYPALTRNLRDRNLIPACAACRQPPAPAPTRRLSPLPRLQPRQPLPIQVTPIPAETIASYLSRLADANHLPAAFLLAHLPPWFHTQHRRHDDLAGHLQTTTGDAEALAALTGASPHALRKALPALQGAACNRDQQPVRLTIACRRCTARRGLSAEIPVHLPALQRLCPRHHIWLGDSRQIDITDCPDIRRANRRANRLRRAHTAHQILLAETTSREITARWLREDRHPALTRRWTARAATMSTDASPHDLRSPEHEDHLTALTYPETITLTAVLLASRTPTADTSDPRTDHLADHLIGPP
jgi:hypothetical protein